VRPTSSGRPTPVFCTGRASIPRARRGGRDPQICHPTSPYLKCLRRFYVNAFIKSPSTLLALVMHAEGRRRRLPPTAKCPSRPTLAYSQRAQSQYYLDFEPSPRRCLPLQARRGRRRRHAADRQGLPRPKLRCLQPNELSTPVRYYEHLPPPLTPAAKAPQGQR